MNGKHKKGPQSLRARLVAILDEQTPDGKTRLEAMLRMVVKKAQQGAPWAVQFVAERTDGKVRDVLEVAENAIPLCIVEEVVRVGDNPPGKKAP